MFCGIAGPDEVAGVAILLNCCGVKPQPILSNCHYSLADAEDNVLNLDKLTDLNLIFNS
jgi:hypothetical protein